MPCTFNYKYIFNSYKIGTERHLILRKVFTRKFLKLKSQNASSFIRTKQMIFTVC